MIEYTSNVGPYLRELRKSKKLTLKELQQKSGVSLSQISKIEKNLHTPSLETIKKLCEALSVNIDEILQKSGEIQKENHYKDTDFETKYTVLNIYNRTCQMCGAKAPNVEIEITYVRPITDGGERTIKNAITLCKSCKEARKEFIKKNGFEKDLIYLEYGKQA